MSSSQTADGASYAQTQDGPYSAPLTGTEQQARQDRKDTVDGASAPDDASQGDNFVKSFCKMTKEKRDWRDSKDEKEFQKDEATCSYDELAENLVANRVTQEGLAPKIKPNEIVGDNFYAYQISRLYP